MSPNQGGIETFMMNIFLNLEGHGFHFDFLNIYKKGIAYTTEILNHGGTIRNLFIPTGLKGHLIRKRRALRFFNKFRNYYDIIHVNAMSINAIFWIKMAKGVGIRKLIIQSHVSNRCYKNLFQKVCSKILSLASYLYLKNNRNEILELAVDNDSGKYMFHNNNYKVIPNGINTSKFKFNVLIRKELRRKLGLNKNNHVLITVARICYQKNYFRILHIFKLVHDIDSQSRLLIVGNGPDEKALKHLVNRLGLTNKVLFTGIINNVFQILSVADLMLMPSRYEGFPFSLIESQSTGVPAVVSSEAIPKSSNITHTLKYISLDKPNIYWANIILSMLQKSPSNKFKIKMNNLVKKSKYNVDNLISNIQKVYSIEDENN